MGNFFGDFFVKISKFSVGGSWVSVFLSVKLWMAFFTASSCEQVSCFIVSDIAFVCLGRGVRDFVFFEGNEVGRTLRHCAAVILHIGNLIGGELVASRALLYAAGVVDMGVLVFRCWRGCLCLLAFFECCPCVSVGTW